VAVNKLSVVFSTDDSLLSKVIRCRTNSEFSHVDISINGGSFISSKPFVGVASAAVESYRSKFVFDFLITDRQVERIKSFYEETVGAKYDWCGALGVGLNRDWENPEFWYCSEWAAMALQLADVIAVPAWYSGVTPQYLLVAMQSGFGLD
jgi:hypothetical protein